MDEAKLQEIDERRARVLRDGTAAGALCMAADDVPDLVAEVRRLTAALATVTTEHAAALDAARREGAEGMRERCAVVLAGRAAWADYRTEHHTAPGDDPDETRTQMDALDGALAAIRALPLDAPVGGS